MPPVPILVPIAWGNVSNTGTSPGDKLQGSQGCTCVNAGTGLVQVTLETRLLGVPEADIVVTHCPGFGTAPSNGGCTTCMSTFSSGAFTLEIFEQDTTPPALVNAPIHFVVWRKYPNT